MKFDLTKRFTSTEWRESAWNFWKNLVEAIFRIVGWCMLLGVLKYLADKAHSDFLWYLFFGLNALLGTYLLIYFQERFEVVLFDPSKRTRRHMWIEFGVSFVVVIVALAFCNFVIFKLVLTVAELQGVK